MTKSLLLQVLETTLDALDRLRMQAAGDRARIVELITHWNEADKALTLLNEEVDLVVLALRVPGEVRLHGTVAATFDQAMLAYYYWVLDARTRNWGTAQALTEALKHLDETDAEFVAVRENFQTTVVGAIAPALRSGDFGAEVRVAQAATPVVTETLQAASDIVDRRAAALRELAFQLDLMSVSRPGHSRVTFGLDAVEYETIEGSTYRHEIVPPGTRR